MGAPKQKWTSEEEAALKAGIEKYGTGKWSTILKDPQFKPVLQARSNVDLKDKWRNLSCMAQGMGSRTKVRGSIKNKQDEDTTASSSEMSQDTGSRKQISRLDDHIVESIMKLKEQRGSSRSAIAHYIEEHYLAPPDLDRALVATLKTLTENGVLRKVKHQYRIAQTPIAFSAGEDSDKGLPEVERNRLMPLTEAEIDADLEEMRLMTAAEAADAAAQAVAEAEAAIRAVEAAVREAEEVEDAAEAARCFAELAREIHCLAISVSKHGVLQV